MDDNNNKQYEDELNEAIKMSLTNFSIQDQSHKEIDEDTPLLPSQSEEEKVPNFAFTHDDLKDHYAANQVRQSITNQNDIFEESKDVIEELSEAPPSIQPSLEDMGVENLQETLKDFMEVFDTYYPEESDMNGVLKLLNKITSNI